MKTISGYQITRQSIALTLSVLLIPFAPQTVLGQGYVPLDPLALDQMVAPIALYPDSLVAQILTASTYPQQVSDADNWSRQNAALPPQERADIANTMPWDPSVKALTAFPSVLDNLARNYSWMSALGNAYYNQPGDVMNAVQAARIQAQRAGYLRPTPQLRVVYVGGLITIVPVNPEIVYVPYYDPWRIYGGWVRPYAGFYVAPPPPGVVIGLGIGFAAIGISIGLFAHYGWGFHAWEPNWHSGVVVYNHNTYISNSVTVINRGNFGAYNRGVFERPGPGVPANFRPPVTRSTANFTPAPNVTRAAPGAFNRAPVSAARPAPQFQGRPPARSAAPQVQRSQGPPPPNYQRQQNLSRAPAPAPHVQAAPQRSTPPQQHSAPQPHAMPSRQAPPPQAQRAEPHGHSEDHPHH